MVQDLTFLIIVTSVGLFTAGTIQKASNTEEMIVWQAHDIIMQCPVNRTDYEQIVWKKNAELVAVGSVLFFTDSRVRLLGQGRLQISNSRMEDTGKYSCQPGARAPENSRYEFIVTIEEYTCPSITPPHNGKVVFHPLAIDGRHRNGTIAVVTCDEGFELAGKKNRTCCDCFDGWDGETASCLSQELLNFKNQLSAMEKQLEAKVLHSLAVALNKSLNFKGISAALENVTKAQNTLEQWVHVSLEKMDTTLANMSQLRVVETHKLESQMHKMDIEMGKVKYKQAHSDKYAGEQILAVKVALGSLEKNIMVANNRTVNASIDPAFTKEVRQNLTEIKNRTMGALEELNFQLKTFNGNIDDVKHNMQYVFGNNSVVQLWETMQKHAVATKNLVKGHIVSEYLWIVHQIEAKISKVHAQADWMASVQSSYFYTDIPGYRFRLVLYPNYEMSDHIGIFAGLVPGEFDSVLPWPFRQEFHLAIMSHDSQVSDHVGLVQFPSSTCSPSNFDKPEKSQVPSACGFRHFFSLEQLNRKKGAYLTAGHLWVRIRIFS